MWNDPKLDKIPRICARSSDWYFQGSESERDPEKRTNSRVSGIPHLPFVTSAILHPKLCKTGTALSVDSLFSLLVFFYHSSWLQHLTVPASMALTPTHPSPASLALLLTKVRRPDGMTPKLCRTHSYYLTFVCAAPLSQLHQTLTTAYIQPHSFAPAPEHWSTRALENPSILAGEHQPENMTTKNYGSYASVLSCYDGWWFQWHGSIIGGEKDTNRTRWLPVIFSRLQMFPQFQLQSKFYRSMQSLPFNSYIYFGIIFGESPIFNCIPFFLPC